MKCIVITLRILLNQHFNMKCNLLYIKYSIENNFDGYWNWPTDHRSSTYFTIYWFSACVLCTLCIIDIKKEKCPRQHIILPARPTTMRNEYDSIEFPKNRPSENAWTIYSCVDRGKAFQRKSNRTLAFICVVVFRW